MSNHRFRYSQRLTLCLERSLVSKTTWGYDGRHHRCLLLLSLPFCCCSSCRTRTFCPGVCSYIAKTHIKLWLLSTCALARFSTPGYAQLMYLVSRFLLNVISFRRFSRPFCVVWTVPNLSRSVSLFFSLTTMCAVFNVAPSYPILIPCTRRSF